jgi:hypothetical protein
MAFQTHISLANVDERINHWMAAHNHEPWEDGPYELRNLYEFVLDGIAQGSFEDGSAVCAHVRRRVREFFGED